MTDQANAGRTPEAERVAWQAAYHGTDGFGCASAGFTAGFAPSDYELIVAAFAEELGALAESTWNDPALLAGVDAWIVCMADQGFSFSAPEEAVYSIRDEFGAGIPEDRLEDFQAHELAVATADVSCPFNNFGGWETAYEDVLSERQEQFAKEHEAEILALLEGPRESGE